MHSVLQDLGYQGDVGYQTFLYSNEADIRRIFMFLVEKLPKETTQTSEEPLGQNLLCVSENMLIDIGMVYACS